MHGDRLIKLTAHRNLLQRSLAELDRVTGLPDFDPRLKASLQTAVDDVIAASETLDRVIQELYRNKASRRQLIVAGFLLFALVAGLFAILSLRRVQKNADALRTFQIAVPLRQRFVAPLRR